MSLDAITTIHLILSIVFVLIVMKNLKDINIYMNASKNNFKIINENFERVSRDLDRNDESFLKVKESLEIQCRINEEIFRKGGVKNG